MRGGAPQQTQIHTGLSDGTVTEVVDGLAEGDEVVIDLAGGEGSTSSSSKGSSMPRMF
jgi:hypothetical protein